MLRPPEQTPLPATTFFDRAWRWEFAHSRLPDGFWGRIDRDRLQEEFRGMVSQAETAIGVGDGETRSLVSILLGRFSTSTRTRGLPPLRLSIPTPAAPTDAREPAGRPRPAMTDLECYGRLPLTWLDDDGLHALVLREGRRRDKDSRALPGWLLEPMLTWLALRVFDADLPPTQSGPVVGGRALVVHAVWNDATRVWRADTDDDTARRILQELGGDWLTQRTFDDLRFGVLEAAGLLPPPDDATDASYAAMLREKAEEVRGSDWEPSFFTRLFATIGPPPVPDDALDKVRRRLLPLCRLVGPRADGRGRRAAQPGGENEA